jgi:hypothetical protein
MTTQEKSAAGAAPPIFFWSVRHACAVLAEMREAQARNAGGPAK